jgi:hypothetical protein
VTYAVRSALRHLVHTFFEGSQACAVSALLDLDDTEISDADLDRLEGLVREARRSRRR